MRFWEDFSQAGVEAARQAVLNSKEIEEAQLDHLLRHGAVLADMTEGSRCLLYTSPSPRDGLLSRMPSSA